MDYTQGRHMMTSYQTHFVLPGNDTTYSLLKYSYLGLIPSYTTRRGITVEAVILADQ